jgi:hypothetical protein
LFLDFAGILIATVNRQLGILGPIGSTDMKKKRSLSGYARSDFWRVVPRCLPDGQAAL